jgi:hypothetical protein
MNPELFPDLPPMLSPKLEFLRKHGLATAYDYGLAQEGDPAPWGCYRNRQESDPRGITEAFIGIGADEDAAILDYCAKRGLKHWTLEGTP